MKKIKFIYGLMAAMVLSLASCDVNDYPEFNDADAFLAFTNTAITVGEESGLAEIAVQLASLSGLSASVDVEVVPDESGKDAVEGVDFNIENKTLSFAGFEGATQKIKVKIIDNDVFTGNKSFTLRLKEGGSVNLGASKTCRVTIKDDEHPLLFIIGDYTTSVASVFSGRGPWDNHVISINIDDEDVNKVWISNIDPYFAQYGYVAPDENLFYGIVNADKTEIQIPVGQEIGYDDVCLYGFTTPNPDDGDLIDTGNVVLSIEDDGQKLVFKNAIGVCRSSNLEGGWFNLMAGPITLTKK